VQVIRVISGDHELCALDFQKHYRLPIVHLMDPDQSFEQQYNPKGWWPFLMLIGPDGKLKHRCTNLLDREHRLIALLKKAKATRQGISTQVVDGVAYMPGTLERSGESQASLPCERLSSLAAGPNNKVYLVLTSSRASNSDIMLRVWDGESWSHDVPVAATEADEYDGTVIVDNEHGKVWICWTSNALDNTYNIYVTNLEDTLAGAKPTRVTYAPDDAMHGRTACDAQGRLWITYYQWRKNRSGISRDKEVYVRYLDGTHLSQAIQISPTDIPSYEDHTDPSIIQMGKDMMVCWSWDFHQPKGYTTDALSPSIFARLIDDKLTAGKPFHVSQRHIDMVPVLGSGRQGVTWCAWDSLVGGPNSKSLCLRSMTANSATSKTITISQGLTHLCSPCFAFSDEQDNMLVWCQTQNGQDWTLEKSVLNPKNKQWSQPHTLALEGNPRYSSAVYDANGQLWVAYARETPAGRRVIAEALK